MYCFRQKQKKICTRIDAISFPLHVFKPQLVVSADVELMDVESTEYTFSF